MADTDYKRRFLTYCMHCNKVFSGRASYKNRREKNQPAKFCSKQCSFDRMKLVNKEIAAIRRIALCEKSKHELLQGEKHRAIFDVLCKLRVITKQKAKVERAARPCKACGNPVGYTFGRSKIFCSYKCSRVDQKQRPEYREKLKASRKKRKAIERGAKVGEPFTYRQIFLRDKWQCKMCGVKTPEKFRGTLEPNAPELDHIMPLSKGGSHSIDNVQLLCRSCNAWKSDRVLSHQLGLFTSLL